MTKIERVISMHHRLTDGLESNTFAEYKETVLEALGEKQEREKGCEYCNDETPLTEPGMSHEFAIRDNGILFYDSELGWEGTEIKFCPMCGRELKARGE